MFKRFLQTALFVYAVFGSTSYAQTTFPTNGAPYITHSIYAFKNAVIHVDEATELKNAILLVQDNTIIGAGEKLEIPANAVVYDLKGKHIYPSFIDLYSDYGVSVKSNRQRERGPQMESNIKGAYGWNQAVRPEFEAHKVFLTNKEQANELKKNGFGVVLSSSKDGVVRGSGVLVHLGETKENDCIYKDKAAGFYSFNKGSSTQDYPSSLTGAIALLRQTYLDAAWYKSVSNKQEYNISLEAFNQLQSLPSIFESNDKFNHLRADKVGKEMNVKYIIKACGNEYQRISEMQQTFLKFIVPLNFPEVMDVEDPYDAENVSLAEMKHWELAPTNPAAFERSQIPFCLTAADLKDKSKFLPNLRKAIQYGLSEKAALKALTANPATFIAMQDKLGALKKGYYANFFISNVSIFEDDGMVLQNWTNGIPSTYKELMAKDIRGNYLLNTSARNFKVNIKGDELNPSATVFVDTIKVKAQMQFQNSGLTMSFKYDSNSVTRLNGTYDATTQKVIGRGQWADGSWYDFTMSYQSADTTKKVIPTKAKMPTLGKVIYPFQSYGEAIPESEGLLRDNWKKFKERNKIILIKDATVWTNSGDTILNEYDVYIVDGRIVRIAPNIDAPKDAFAKIIDAKGKHLTPGIIDEHSHIALTMGVNEGTQSSSAEVRMGDVINPEDVNIYRQLSGGVTTAQLLHGSANAIGGQSAIIKLRWGATAEDMKFEKADGFIKFALGENVKQANWGDMNTIRFPQTRMGVEQVYNDLFTRAREYDKQWASFSKFTPKQIEKDKIIAPRRDLELECLAEILNRKRFITCHSYVQSEINMLMHIADTFGFKVNTFTHILEGYKVADKMKAHGVSASTFADWWAYKNEVMEAIPYNAAILTKVGVNTSMNSDDAEMARRLNQEAAKAIKYGGLTEVEALKLVTLNPAKMLHLDDKVGSIKVGKTADLVIWTDNPMSIYAKADKTLIDGQIYFDRDEDLKLREYIKMERARLIALLVAEKHKGVKAVKPNPKKQRLYHCNTIEGVDEEITGHR
jgi:imidazolonepropionase-like amidohydrolase